MHRLARGRPRARQHGARPHPPAAQGHESSRADSALGSTMRTAAEGLFEPQPRRKCSTTSQVTIGGRIAEEILTGDVSPGPSMDIRQATPSHGHGLPEFGMSDKVGMVPYGSDDVSSDARWGAESLRRRPAQI